MNILDTKYISEDELTNIIYSAEPEHIFDFCRVNKITAKICGRISWKKYINSNQNIYDRLLMTTAKNGYQKVFEHLINNNDKYGVIINRRAIQKCFRLAVINGYDDFADYIWKTVKSHTHTLQRSKYNVLLEQFIQSGKLKQSIKFIEDIIKRYESDNLSEDISYIINNSLNTSPSYKFMKIFIDIAQLKFSHIYTMDTRKIFSLACRHGNMNIVIGMLSEEIDLNPIKIVFFLLGCPSSVALKLLKKKYPRYGKFISLRHITNGYIILRNSDIVYDLISRLSEHESSQVLLFSPLAFKPYEFINMLNYENLCYNDITLHKVITILNEKSENYYTKILEEEAPLCEPKL